MRGGADHACLQLLRSFPPTPWLGCDVWPSCLEFILSPFRLLLLLPYLSMWDHFMAEIISVFLLSLSRHTRGILKSPLPLLFSRLGSREKEDLGSMPFILCSSLSGSGYSLNIKPCLYVTHKLPARRNTTTWNLDLFTSLLRRFLFQTLYHGTSQDGW